MRHGWPPDLSENARRRRGPGTALRVLVGVVVLALVAAGGWYGYRTFIAPDDPSSEAGPPHPDSWDPRVAPLVAFVEKERGLTFEHPVYVRYLKPAAFEKALLSGKNEATAEDKKEIERYAGLFRALGLLADGVDLGAVSRDLTAAGTVGFYAFDDEVIRVRGSRLTPDVRQTLVHELTHALQDQHFDIGDRFEDLSEQDDPTPAQMLQVVTEGDASRVATQYEKKHPGGRTTRAERQDKRRTARRIARIPRALVAFGAAPYALGEQMLELAVTLDGEDAVDDLLRTPPVSEEEVLDPWLLLRESGSTEVLDVDEPALGRREKEFDSGTFGAFAFYFMLAQRLGPKVAIRASDGWGGDAYVGYEKRGRSCMRVAYRGDTARDTRELADALDAWAVAGPSDATVDRGRGALTFDSCDPRGIGTDDPVEAAVVSFPLARTQLLDDVLTQGIPEDAARCYALGIVEELSVEELQVDEPSPELNARIQAVAGRCAAGG